MTVSNAQDTTPAISAPPAATAAPKWFGALGLLAGFGAVVASSCCVIPLGLAAAGAGAGILGGLEAVSAWRVPLLFASALALVGGWGAWLLKPPVCASGPGCAASERSRATLALLLCASAIVLAAASWSHIDPLLLKLLRGR